MVKFSSSISATFELGMEMTERCEGAEADGADANLFDGSGLSGDGAEVVDADGAAHHDGDSSEEVGECLLRGEGDGEAADAETRDEG